MNAAIMVLNMLDYAIVYIPSFYDCHIYTLTKKSILIFGNGNSYGAGTKTKM